MQLSYRLPGGVGLHRAIVLSCDALPGAEFSVGQLETPARSDDQVTAFG
jgi:hypothetical protein